MAYKNLFAEVLAAQADQLRKGIHISKDYVQLFPGEPELHALLALTERIKAVLQPVEPDPAFKAQLQRDLLAAAYLRQAEAEQEKTGLQILLSPKVSIPLTMAITVAIGLLLRRGRQIHPELVQPATLPPDGEAMSKLRLDKQTAAG